MMMSSVPFSGDDQIVEFGFKCGFSFPIYVSICSLQKQDLVYTCHLRLKVLQFSMLNRPKS